MNTIKQPDLHVIVYNLKEREGTNFNAPKQFIPPVEIDISYSVKSISTSKSKAEPTGNFNIELSSEKNWVASLSTGSWVAILMSDQNIPDQDKKFFNGKSLKMIGRIDSVRVSRSVDQLTGAYQTSYSVSGRDWGQMLEDLVYLDEIAAAVPTGLAGSPIDSSFGAAARINYDKVMKDAYGEEALLSTSTVSKLIIRILGQQGLSLNITSAPAGGEKGNFNIERYLPTSGLLLPPSMCNSMKITSTKFVDALTLVSGILIDKNEYKDTAEAVGHFDVRNALGINSMWSILKNTVTVGGINELVADLDFGKGVSLNLYKRVKPFSLKASSFSATKNSIESPFFFLPHVKIDSSEIVSLDTGTNWRDVVNFIEVMPQQQFMGKLQFQPSQFKAFNADYNSASYAISGFKPLMMNTNFLPPNSGGGMDLEGIAPWVKTIKGWFFDAHKMLNGGIVFSGKSEYIQVGSNIMIPAKAVAEGSFTNSSGSLTSFAGDAAEQFILGHVETVSHNFSVSPEGSRSFFTSISYSRGIIVDGSGTRSNEKAFGIDDEADLNRSNSNTLVI